jgi:hypothetical protein
MKLGADWDRFTTRPQQFHDAGPTVVVEGCYTATHKATGKTLDAQMCHVLKIRDGKLTSFQQFTNTAHTPSAPHGRCENLIDNRQQAYRTVQLAQGILYLLASDTILPTKVD